MLRIIIVNSLGLKRIHDAGALALGEGLKMNTVLQTLEYVWASFMMCTGSK
jgi:muramidase (phage lysozyme)